MSGTKFARGTWPKSPIGFMKARNSISVSTSDPPGLRTRSASRKKVAARIEVKRGLDAHHRVEMLVREGEPGGIHAQESAAGRALAGGGELRLRDVDRRYIRRRVAAHEMPGGCAGPAGHVEDAPALVRDPAGQLVDQRLAGLALRLRAAVPKPEIIEAAVLEIVPVILADRARCRKGGSCVPGLTYNSLS